MAPCVRDRSKYPVKRRGVWFAKLDYNYGAAEYCARPDEPVRTGIARPLRSLGHAVLKATMFVNNNAIKINRLHNILATIKIGAT